MVLMNITVPDGLQGGDAMSVEAGGQEFTLTVPDGLGPGDGGLGPGEEGRLTLLGDDGLGPLAVEAAVTGCRGRHTYRLYYGWMEIEI